MRDPSPGKIHTPHSVSTPHFLGLWPSVPPAKDTVLNVPPGGKRTSQDTAPRASQTVGSQNLLWPHVRRRQRRLNINGQRFLCRAGSILGITLFFLIACKMPLHCYNLCEQWGGVRVTRRQAGRRRTNIWLWVPSWAWPRGGTHLSSAWVYPSLCPALFRG